MAQDEGDLPSYLGGELLRLVVVELLPLAPAEHCEALAEAAARTYLGSRDEMIMHVRNDLCGGSAVVLDNVPVVDARGSAEGLGEDADGGAQTACLGRCGVGELRPVGSRTDEEVTGAEGQNVEEGDEGRGREDEEGSRRGETGGEGGRRRRGGWAVRGVG